MQIDPGRRWSGAACGTDHTLAIDADGGLWGWGSSTYGQLALGARNSGAVHPTPIDEARRWRAVAAGHLASLAIDVDGALWAAGNNGEGRLGLDDPFCARVRLTRVGDAADWRAVALGACHGLGLRGADGALWAWGLHQHAPRAGRGLPVAPRPARLGEGFAAIAAGASASLALDVDGALWTWGDGSRGQLGDGAGHRPAPARVDPGPWAAIACGGHQALALRRDASLWTWGDGGRGQAEPEPRRVALPEAVVAFAAGEAHALAITADGRLWGWGRDAQGCLDGRGDLATPVRLGVVDHSPWSGVAAGAAHSVGWKPDGALWGWGSDAHGQRGWSLPRRPSPPPPSAAADLRPAALACSEAPFTREAARALPEALRAYLTRDPVLGVGLTHQPASPLRGRREHHLTCQTPSGQRLVCAWRFIKRERLVRLSAFDPAPGPGSSAAPLPGAPAPRDFTSPAALFAALERRCGRGALRALLEDGRDARSAT